jgi:hypothetical protein
MTKRKARSTDYVTETVKLSILKDHPRNYQEHPDDQLEHIIQSIRDNGIYRNIVVSRDDFILAGHGVTKACRKMGMEEIPVKRIDVAHDHPQALKVLAGDNYISHLGVVDDRALSEVLKDVKDQSDDGLLGTGFDDMMLANLVFVTRPESEVKDFDAAAHWVGMPEYEPSKELIQVVVSFKTKEDQAAFVERVEGLQVVKRQGRTWSAWWPLEDKKDKPYQETSKLVFED